MMNSGLTMNAPTNELETMRKKMRANVEEYVRNTYVNLGKQEALLTRWENTPTELEDAELQYFNANAARKMIRMWYIIMKVLPAAKRNLLLLNLAHQGQTDNIVKYFDGHYNGAATLRAQTSRVRRNIRELYQEVFESDRPHEYADQEARKEFKLKDTKRRKK